MVALATLLAQVSVGWQLLVFGCCRLWQIPAVNERVLRRSGSAVFWILTQAALVSAGRLVRIVWGRVSIWLVNVR